MRESQRIAYALADNLVNSQFFLGGRKEHEIVIDEARAAYVADVVSNKALPLFGALLRLVCTRAGITQRKLDADSKEWMKLFREKGWVSSTQTVDIHQPTISKASRGELEPSFRQLRIWLFAIRMVYEDPEFEDKCRLKGVKCYSFPKDLERDMRHLALKGDENEICEAYERRRNMVLELTRVEWRNGIEPRLRLGNPDEDPPPAMQGAPLDCR